MVEAAMGVFLFADQSIATCYIEIAVRDIKVRQLFTEKRKSIFTVFFPRIWRDHEEIGSRPKDLRIILLQRSSHAGGSVGMILITVLAHENELLTTGCEVAQY